MEESRGSRGFGSLMFAAIPAALAGAAILWLTAVTGVIDLTSELRQERRAAERVGIVVMPTSPIKVTIREATCLKSAGTYLDGDTLTIYPVNKCTHSLEYPSQFIYRLLAPDGTVIKTEENYIGSNQFDAGEKREFSVKVREDARTVEMSVQLKDGL
jgi:hypothetical protein